HILDFSRVDAPEYLSDSAAVRSCAFLLKYHVRSVAHAKITIPGVVRRAVVCETPSQFCLRVVCRVSRPALGAGVHAWAISGSSATLVIDGEAAILEFDRNPPVAIGRPLHRNLLHFVADLHLHRRGLSRRPRPIKTGSAQAGHLT